jgi:predicted MFS family arabinose efflux permease
VVGATVSMKRSLGLFYAFRLLATSYVYMPIFMLFQASRGLTFGESLALGGIFSGVVVLVEVPTGVFADRVGRRRSMLLGALTMVVSCAIAARSYSFGELAIAEALAALSIALCSGADSAYLFDFLRQHDRVHEYSRHESTASAFHLLGSAVAFFASGFLAQIDLALPYVVTAGIAGVAAIVACLMDDDRHLARAAPSSKQVSSAVGDVLRNPRLLWLVGYSAVVFVLVRATVYLYQPYLHARGLGLVAIGVLFASVYCVASLVAYRTHALRKRVGDELMLWGLLGIVAVSFLGLAGASAGPWLLGLLGVQAIANGIYSPLTKPLINAEIADSRRRAAVLSVESMARRVAMGLFAPLVGLWGQDDVMILCGAVGLGGFALLAFARMRMNGSVEVIADPPSGGS